ncbi:MAG: LUD domain-containing protein, partial [Acidimicrobiales bacterium]
MLRVRGLFSFKLPEASVAMADDKLASLPVADEGTVVEIVGADSSCLMHLEGRSRAEHRPVATRHIAEMLAASLPDSLAPIPSRDVQAQRTGPPVSRESDAAAPQQAAVLDGGLAHRLGPLGPAIAGPKSREPDARPTSRTNGHQLSGSTLRERTATAVADPVLRARTARAVDRFARHRVAGLAELDDADGLRTAARAAKASVLADLPAVLERMADAVLARGGRVCWAHTAADANAYIARVAAGGSVVKSKSMATEETGLNEALEQAGARVVETDLGEWIIQLAGERPSHIIAPALHHDRHSILDVFEREAGAVGVSTEPTALNAFARSRLRQEFMTADVGVTGVNFGVAESGSIVLVTNEGNGRLVSTLPRVHVAVMDMERVVATWDQLDLLLTLLTRSATGQRLSTYTNVITGHRR